MSSKRLRAIRNRDRSKVQAQIQKEASESLGDYLNNKVFAGQEGSELAPNAEGVKGFDEFIKIYKAGLPIERAAVDSMAL